MIDLSEEELKKTISDLELAQKVLFESIHYRQIVDELAADPGEEAIRKLIAKANRTLDLFDNEEVKT